MFWEVWFWAFNPIALEGIWSVIVVESSEPKGANIGCESPLTNPDIVFDGVGIAKSFSEVVTVLAHVIISWVIPSLVEVMVHDNIGVIFIFVEHVVPGLWIEVESIMEDELKVWSLLLHHCMNFTIETFKERKVGRPPWFVNWLNSVGCWVMTPLLEETVNGVYSPVDAIKIDEVIAAIVIVPLTHPFSKSMRPMLEMGFIKPFSTVSDS